MMNTKTQVYLGQVSPQVKAAQTRKEHDPDAFIKLGREGARVRHNISPERESEIARRSAATRKEHDPYAFVKMGMEGGIARHNKYNVNLSSQNENNKDKNNKNSNPDKKKPINKETDK